MTYNIKAGSHYVPAIGDEVMWSDKIQWANKNFRFFDHGQSFFDHDFLLMSAYYMVSGNYSNHREVARYPDTAVVIGDSGGFQLLTFGKKGHVITVTPMQVLRWLEDNVDIGMNLDYPPDYGHFNDSLKQSMENFKFFEQNRLNYSMKLYNVLHGGNFSEIDQWYKEASQFEFDGWAIGIHPSTNIYLKLIGYLYLLDSGQDNLKSFCHFFGVSGPSNMISLAILADHYESAMTFDSSSWSWGQRFRDYWFSNDIRHCVRLGRLFANKMNDIPCDCPVCSTMSIQQLYDQESPLTPQLLSLHNMHNYIEVNRMINIMVKDDEAIESYTKSLGEHDVLLNTKNIINCYETKGIKYTYDKYKDLFMTSRNEPIESNLYGFSSKKEKVVLRSGDLFNV